MPPGYVIVDARTVRGPDGREHDVLDAIQARSWKQQLCPLMLHEYSMWEDGPNWAWNVIGAMLLARNPDSFRAYFRRYGRPNRYWDAPDGRRYWRSRHEIDRGKPDGAGLRRVDDGAKPPSSDRDGPRFAPYGIGLYDRYEKGWRPTEAAVTSGFLPCNSCKKPKKSAIVASPRDPHSVAAFIASAASQQGRDLTLEELADVLQRYPAVPEGSPPNLEERTTHDRTRIGSSDPGRKKAAEIAGGGAQKDRVIRKLLELRAREAPLGFSGYRGVLTQKAIADVADVPVKDVTQAAIEFDRKMNAADPKAVE